MGPDEDTAMLALLAGLRSCGYRFVTPTPATHARVVARTAPAFAGLRDIFGWTRPFAESDLDAELLAALRASRMCSETEGRLKSAVRVATLGDLAFLHSAYPTDAAEAVFFGPDSYRFAAFIAAELDRHPALPEGAIADLGTGAGVGAILAARRHPDRQVVGTDINPAALRLARINAAAAGVAVDFVEAADGDGLPPLALALANPPYLVDEAGRAYRHGGGELGAELSLTMARQAVAKLVSGGRLLLYTGSAIVGGHDALQAKLADLAASAGCDFAYREIDPDVFGEELAREAYATVERIAAAGAVLTKG